MTMTMLLRLAGRAAACLAIALLLTGCGPQRSTSLNQAITAYNSHHYSSAHHHAVQAMRSATGREREQAAYLAGLSAYQMRNLDEAELRLVAATRSGDARTAGSAKAMLGQVRLDQRRPREAASLFEDAARQLTGHDAAEARRYAAIAHQQAGNTTAANQWAAAGTSGGTSSAGRHQTSSGVFALQVGAFSDRERANQAANDASRLADSNGLGPVKIIPSSDRRGRPLYLVQFGSFSSRDSAARTRSHLGRLDYIVAPRATP